MYECRVAWMRGGCLLPEWDVSGGLQTVRIARRVIHSGKNCLHCKKNLRDSWICFDQTFLGLGLGKLFLARESLVCDIPAGDGNTKNLFFTVHSYQCIHLQKRGEKAACFAFQPLKGTAAGDFFLSLKPLKVVF